MPLSFPPAVLAGTLFALLGHAAFGATTAQIPAGDAGRGASLFFTCKVCHSVTAPDGSRIVPGGRTGPNLYGVIGRTAGSQPEFRYSPGLLALKAAGMAWTPDLLATFLLDPNAFLRAHTGDPAARSRMGLHLSDPQEAADIAAWLATEGPAGAATGGGTGAASAPASK